MIHPAEYYLDLINKEIMTAQSARAQGNEGKVRVCARRLASIAIEWYYSFRNQDIQGKLALEHLQQLNEDTAVPEPIRAAAQRLASRVTPDFKYAYDTDPLKDAQLIADFVNREVSHA